MSNSGRWSLAVLVVVVGLVVALWPRDAEPDPTVQRTPPSSGVTSDTDLGPSRTAAALRRCPTPQPGSSPTPGPLDGITLSCLADGTTVDLGAALAGTPTLLNLWAYWCAPCADELPILQEYAERAKLSVNVLTVHSDTNEEMALARLADLAVHLPGVQDAALRVRTAVGAPPVLPVSVLLRADGSVAKVVVKPFTSVDEIADVVAENLGVAA
ncbi:TlpA family protein disulfide reductase [Antrihabitans sp. YC3-6]|uniref:TlpA family protein disulfide reductase n=1 Tax=Antrihabitans stalagmiti TaxID=2799499 RepID=A0A934NRK9_9NOCA|nr:TlpA disulfide reductase family protein [Antrihabitans stalagmiti]MBJ8340131.1 TlpA family protein disulfide reductase [Antrihabitans stalagmiti]